MPLAHHGSCETSDTARQISPADSCILLAHREDDTNWPTKSVVGKQELEVKVGKTHISFETAKIGSLVDVQNSEDPEGLRVFYYLIQDLRMFVFSLISLHFKIKPTP